MPSKFIIDNRTGLSDLVAVELVKIVVKQGKISNRGRQYCYAMEFTVDDSQYMVYSMLNEKSERFVITERQDEHNI